MEPSSTQRTRSWQEEIDGVFGNTLIPVSRISLLENTLYDRTTCADGVITKLRMPFIIGRKRNEIHIQLFDPDADLRCKYPGCSTSKYCNWLARWFTISSDTNKRFLCR